MVNVEHFHRTMAGVTAENLNMQHWGWSEGDFPPKTSCGTTLCLAGHAVHAAGIGIVWEPEWEERMNSSGEWEDVIVAWSATETTEGELIETKATELLGLAEDQANELFYQTHIRSVEALWEEIEQVTDGVVRRDHKTPA